VHKNERRRYRGRPVQRELSLAGEAATLTVHSSKGQLTSEVRLARWGTAKIVVSPGQPWQEQWERTR